MIILIWVALLALLIYSIIIFKPKNFPPGKSYAVEERLELRAIWKRLL
jgi:hypothetical protein